MVKLVNIVLCNYPHLDVNRLQFLHQQFERVRYSQDTETAPKSRHFIHEYIPRRHFILAQLRRCKVYWTIRSRTHKQILGRIIYRRHSRCITYREIVIIRPLHHRLLQKRLNSV